MKNKKFLILCATSAIFISNVFAQEIPPGEMTVQTVANAESNKAIGQFFKNVYHKAKNTVKAAGNTLQHSSSYDRVSNVASNIYEKGSNIVTNVSQKPDLIEQLANKSTIRDVVLDKDAARANIEKIRGKKRKLKKIEVN